MTSAPMKLRIILIFSHFFLFKICLLSLHKKILTVSQIRITGLRSKWFLFFSLEATGINTSGSLEYPSSQIFLPPLYDNKFVIKGYSKNRGFRMIGQKKAPPHQA